MLLLLTEASSERVLGGIGAGTFDVWVEFRANSSKSMSAISKSHETHAVQSVTLNTQTFTRTLTKKKKNVKKQCTEAIVV